MKQNDRSAKGPTVEGHESLIKINFHQIFTTWIWRRRGA
jgi:hypothetical protein